VLLARVLIATVTRYVDLAVDREGPLCGGTEPLRELGRQPPTRRGAKSQAVADLPIGVRGGSQHHSAMAKQ
jgi:hypothetical protein